LSKKTVDAILYSGNDDLIQVKGKQLTLFQAVSTAVKTQPPLSTNAQPERSRGRDERRTVAVFPAPAQMTEEWNGLARVIHVERDVTRDGKNTITDHYYISSVRSDDATVFAQGVRGHWSIENRLHWVKDVIQHEDD
jgi:predicted transposase YbfD/YdcC